MSERRPTRFFHMLQSSFLDDIIGAALWIVIVWALGQHVLTGGFSFTVHLWFGLFAVSSCVWMLFVSSLFKRGNYRRRQHWLLTLVTTLVTSIVLWRFIIVHDREPPRINLVIQVEHTVPGMPTSILLRRDLPKWLEGFQPRIEATFDSHTKIFSFPNVRGGEWFLAPLPSSAYPLVGPIEIPPKEGENYPIPNILPMEPLDPSVLRRRPAPLPPQMPLPPKVFAHQEESKTSKRLPAETSPKAPPSPKPTPSGVTKSERKTDRASDYIPDGFSSTGRRLIDEVSAQQRIDNAKSLRKSDPNKAKSMLGQVIREFPGTEMARRAQIELNSIWKEEEEHEN